MSTGLDSRLKTAGMTGCFYASDPEQLILAIHLSQMLRKDQNINIATLSVVTDPRTKGAHASLRVQP